MVSMMIADCTGRAWHLIPNLIITSQEGAALIFTRFGLWIIPQVTATQVKIGSRRWNLRLPDLHMSYNGLTQILGARTLARALAAMTTYSIVISHATPYYHRHLRAPSRGRCRFSPGLGYFPWALWPCGELCFEVDGHQSQSTPLRSFVNPSEGRRCLGCPPWMPRGQPGRLGGRVPYGWRRRRPS